VANERRTALEAALELVPEGSRGAASAAAPVSIAATVDAAVAAAAAASCRHLLFRNVPSLNKISRFLYLHLRHAMIPASKGWCADVTLGSGGQIVLVCAPKLSITTMTGEHVLDRTLGTKTVLNH